MSELSEAAREELTSMLNRSFEWSVDYTIPNASEDEFIGECRILDEIAAFCGIQIDSFEKEGRKVLSWKRGES